MPNYNKFLPDFLAGKGVACDADDHSVGFVKFENGASMQFEASFGSYVERERIFQAIHGDKSGARREVGEPVKRFSKVADAYTTIVPRISQLPDGPLCRVHPQRQDADGHAGTGGCGD